MLNPRNSSERSSPSTAKDILWIYDKCEDFYSSTVRERADGSQRMNLPSKFLFPPKRCTKHRGDFCLDKILQLSMYRFPHSIGHKRVYSFHHGADSLNISHKLYESFPLLCRVITPDHLLQVQEFHILDQGKISSC